MNAYKFICCFLTLFLACFASSVLAQDDAYEPNDYRSEAYFLPEQTWLSSISGPGIQYNEDVYEIIVSPNTEYIQVDCLFTHAHGDIEIILLDAEGTWISEAWTDTDNEHLFVNVQPSGTYYSMYIMVWWGDQGNPYDLRWNRDDGSADDAYEPNDTPESAYPLPKNTWLSDISGPGIQRNDDVYKISVASGPERVQVDCQFTHADGNIDIALFNKSQTFVETSVSVTDNEQIDIVAPSAGTYYIWVGGFPAENQGNPYDLWWRYSSGEPLERITLPLTEEECLICAWDATAMSWAQRHKTYNNSGAYIFQIPEWNKWYWVGLWDLKNERYIFGKWIGHFKTD